MNWKTILGKLAPTAASALLGPMGGAAVIAIGSIFGISEPTQDKIKEALESGQMTGEQLSALKTLEMKLKAEEEERGFRYAELEVKDVASARERDASFVKAGTKNYRADVMFVLAVAVICGLVYLIWKDPTVNEFMKGIVTLVLGRFLGYLDNIYNFEFGSTRSGQRKTEIIAQAGPIK